MGTPDVGSFGRGNDWVWSQASRSNFIGRATEHGPLWGLEKWAAETWKASRLPPPLSHVFMRWVYYRVLGGSGPGRAGLRRSDSFCLNESAVIGDRWERGNNSPTTVAGSIVAWPGPLRNRSRPAEPVGLISRGWPGEDRGSEIMNLTSAFRGLKIVDFGKP